ncbi:MAG: hypothetical protein JNK65_07185 [Deltaproteobacteria bacterium]|nr:hypothetical protein [Deltaproteobacteria bacterium]
MKKIILSFFSCFLFTLSFCYPLQSAPLTREQVPEVLRSWIDWVMQNQVDRNCPFLNGQEQRECIWPSGLKLDLQEKGGSFSQSWSVYQESLIPLPGDEQHWPQSVTVNGQPAGVILKYATPQIVLKPGTYQISGSFQWNAIPETLKIHPQTGLIQLSLNGKGVAFPKRDEEGHLWLEKATIESGQENQFEIRVHRLLKDEVPAILTTRIQLNISGKNQEMSFEKILPDGFVPMSLQSPLPARLEKEGALKVQTRPGNWTIEVLARHEGPLSTLTLPEAKEGWAAEELWAFEAQNRLRLVSVEGAASIDPTQTTMPQEWRSFPTYLLKPGESLNFTEKRRGDSDPAPDQLTLNRALWLDFNGKGFTIQDDLNGNIQRSDRLEMNPPQKLGRISVNGQERLITHLKDQGLTGVEIEKGNIQVKADSRIDGKLRSFSAVGWNHDFQQVSAQLHLPPGWKIFSATGVDEAPGTWMSRWNLMDFFLVLLIAFSTAKLFGKRWGVFALLVMALTFPESGAPQWIWLLVLTAESLLRLIQKGWAPKLLNVLKWSTLVILVLIAIPFMVQQIRQGLYPTLEKPYQQVSSSFGVPFGGMAGAPPAPVAAPTEEAKVDSEGNLQQQDLAVMNKPGMNERLKKSEPRKKMEAYLSSTSLNLYEHAQGAKVQTGPGLPRWQWDSIRLIWNGPVNQDQVLSLTLLSPLCNLILAFVRVLFLSLMIALFFGFLPRRLRSISPSVKGVMGVAIFLAFSSLAIPQGARAEIPSKELLEELKTRLIENPLCYPECASLSRASLEANVSSLKIRLEVGAQAMTAIPLPGSTAEWSPQQVSLDGKSDLALWRSDEGVLWAQIPEGGHQILMEGPLPEKDSIQISFPLKPKWLSTNLGVWSANGIHDGGIPEDTIQLTRSSVQNNSSQSGVQNENLASFVEVERYLNLQFNWEIKNTVLRRTPLGSSIVLEIPLLEGESVTTPGVRVENGKVLVSLAPNANDFTWNSSLQTREEILLKAPENVAWTEVWKIKASPIWHVQSEGIPNVHPENPEEASVQEWRPWASEELKLRILRPEAVEGSTFTIDQSNLVVRPGARMSEMALSLEMRSSLGGQHILTLPNGSELQSVLINGQTQPVRQDQNQVTLPIVPGSQKIELKWLQAQGIRFFYQVPSISLGARSVNAEIQIELGIGRWVMLTGGPRLGPAVLFWSLFIVLILVSYALSRTPLTPLKTYEWILLGIGLSQVPLWAAAFVAGWLLLLGWREKNIPQSEPWFNFRQLMIVGMTLIAVGVLFAAIYQGLMGVPDMVIEGNGSSSALLKWYQDITVMNLPQPWLVSVPLWFYRLFMLLWALWISAAFLKWLKWGWDAFSTGGRWKKMQVVKKTPPPSTGTSGEAK